MAINLIVSQVQSHILLYSTNIKYYIYLKVCKNGVSS
jgi:hypothetical protein